MTTAQLPEKQTAIEVVSPPPEVPPDNTPALSIDEMFGDLFDKERRFSERYAVHLDRGRAVMEAGYSTKKENALKLADNMLAKPRIRECVQACLDIVSAHTLEIDGPRIRQELQAMATTRVADFFEMQEVVLRDDKGNPILREDGQPWMERRFVAKDFTQMDNRGIKSIKISENKFGQQVQLEAFNQQDALVKLGRSKGEFLEEAPRPISVTFHMGFDMPPKRRRPSLAGEVIEIKGEVVE